MKFNLKSTLLALLTTLFVSATPYTAFATADEGNNLPSQQSCVPFENALSDADRARIASEGGSVSVLEGVQASAFLSRLETLIGQKAPFVVNQIVIVHPSLDSEGDNIAFFSGNCMKAIMQLPVSVVETLLSPNEQPQGERVD